MHTTRPDGTVISSSCDYCQKLWDPDGDTIMIEGHQGALLCLSCLSIAYADVVHHGGGFEHQGGKCRMCLEERAQPQWESPVVQDDKGKGVLVCLRCIKQAATALEKDPETGWKRPKK